MVHIKTFMFTFFYSDYLGFYLLWSPVTLVRPRCGEFESTQGGSVS